MIVRHAWIGPKSTTLDLKDNKGPPKELEYSLVSGRWTS